MDFITQVLQIIGSMLGGFVLMAVVLLLLDLGSPVYIWHEDKLDGPSS